MKNINNISKAIFIVILGSIGYILFDLFVANRSINSFLILAILSGSGLFPAFFYSLKKGTVSSYYFKMMRKVKLEIICIAILNILSFTLFLIALSNENALTVTMLYQLQPFFQIFVGKVFVGDTVKNWTAFFVAAFCSIVGIILFNSCTIENGCSIVGYYELIMVLSIIVAVVSSTIQTKITRNVKGFNGGVAIQNIEVISLFAKTIAGFVLAYLGWFSIHDVSYDFPLITWIALIFIGALPVCVGAILRQDIINKIGIPKFEIISSTKPLMVHLLTLVVAIMYSKQVEMLDLVGWLGMLLTIGSVIIVIKFAKPVAPKKT